MKRLYETTFVLDPQLKANDIEDTVRKITTFITNHGGEIVKLEEWGKRRLAYEINKKQYGYYVHIRFEAPGQLIHLLEREYKLSEAVLRYLTIKVDKLALKAQRIREEKAARLAQEKLEASEAAAAGTPPETNETIAGTETSQSAAPAETAEKGASTPEPGAEAAPAETGDVQDPVADDEPAEEPSTEAEAPDGDEPKEKA